MISSIIALLGSSAFGSIIGGVFALLNRKADVDTKKLELEHERARWSHDGLMRDKDLEIARAEAQGRKEVAIIEGEASIDSARMEAIGQIAGAERVTAEDIKAAGKFGFLLVFASVFNRLIRPVLTVLLAFAALWLNWVMISHMTDGWSTMTASQQYEAGMQAFAWVTAQASTAFAYWFVSRGSGK
jgi:hypothetical protein